MRRFLCVAAAASLGGIVGCEETSTPPASTSTGTNNGVMGTNTPGTTTPSTPTTQTAWNQAADAAERSLQTAKDRIDALAARAATATGEAKTRIETEVQDLRERASTLEDRIAELRRSSATAWASLRDSVTEEIAELNREIDDAMPTAVATPPDNPPPGGG